jgi:protein-L-isoaspartate O-methyltransferase
MLTLIINSIATIGLFTLVAFFGYATFAGAPFTPVRKKANERAMRMLTARKMGSARKAVDIGSGDGRVVLALAKAGFEAHGVEINPALVLIARLRIRLAGLSGKAIIHRANMWHTDFAEYDVIVIFGISYIMKRLEEKCQKETSPGTIVIVQGWPFPTWKPMKREGKTFLYVR